MPIGGTKRRDPFADSAVDPFASGPDYGGGHRGNAEHYEIYQHGIQTVINALTAASKTGLDDMQTRVLHSMGANVK